MTAETTIDLGEVLKKCNKEEEIEEDDQPFICLYEEESIKCRWCPGFKGSQEPMQGHQPAY